MYKKWDFKSIELGDREHIEAHVALSFLRSCNYSFAHLLTWPAYESVEWCEAEGFLVIRISEWGKEPYYLQPVGEGDYRKILPALEGITRTEFNVPLRLHLFGDIAPELRRMGYAIYEERSQAEYIYPTEALRSLAGRKYQAKRNHLSNFTSSYNYRYESLSPRHFAECLQLDSRWREAHSIDGDTPLMRHDRMATEAAFEHWEALGLQGGVLYVDDKMVAFTYGSRINHDTFDIIMEKGDVDYNGVFAAINKFFAEDISYAYINREEDLGLEGLRRSKLSYHPSTILPVYDVVRLDKRAIACRELWQRVFGDDEQNLDHFFSRYYHDYNVLTIEHEEQLLAMLHMIPCECDGARVGYIYGVATAPEARNQGYATRLMREATAEAERRGYNAIVLIPAEENLRHFYARFGFEGNLAVHFSTDDGFDFGTGDSTRDRLCVLPLDSSFKDRYCERPTPITLKVL